MTKKGTEEWADVNINIGRGCLHDCLYCYAKNIASRFRRKGTEIDWKKENIVIDEVNKRRYKKKGVRLFPSSHDITPYYLPYATDFLCKFLSVGNEIIIVSKPHFFCIESLCRSLEQYKSQIIFRFTIGTLDPTVSEFWEPNAPTPTERIKCLEHAYNLGFKTSVSCEPMLEGTDGILRVLSAVTPYISTDIWIGKMRQPEQRVGIGTPEKVRAIKQLKSLQSDTEILRLVSIIKGNPMIKWKDTIQDVINSAQIRQ